MKINNLVLLSFLFACIGLSAELFFTAFSSVIKAIQLNTPINWALKGHSYVWMLFIYMLIPIIYKFILPYVQHINLFLRAFLGVVIIYIVEFISGFLLDLMLGACPWEYTQGWHVCGYIRLDYFLFWYAFALFVINLYHTLDKRIQ